MNEQYYIISATKLNQLIKELDFDEWEQKALDCDYYINKRINAMITAGDIEPTMLKKGN